MEGLTIVRLAPEYLTDYLYFFEHVAHTDYPAWDRCYCLDYCATDNRLEAASVFGDADTRRAYAIRYVNEGILQGYLAYADGQVVGWCNANDRAACRRCAGYVEMLGERAEDDLRIKSVFCFTVAPAMRGRHIAMALLERVIPAFEALEAWDDESILNAMVGLAEAMGAKNAKVMWPVRIAIAGKAVTPGGAVELARILGKDEVLRRIRLGVDKLEAAL